MTDCPELLAIAERDMDAAVQTVVDQHRRELPIQIAAIADVLYGTERRATN